MEDMKTTVLLDVLKSKDSYKEIVNTPAMFITSTLSEYLSNLIDLKGLKKSDVIARAGLERSYSYQILSGKKEPSRDKLLLLAFGMELTFQEVQDLLKVNGYAMLYPKNRRDSLITFALYKGQSIFELNENLLTMNEEIIV